MTDTTQGQNTGQTTDQTKFSSITIQGVELEVPQPYAEGHVLKAGEASALNQTLAENLRNNFAPVIKKVAAEYRKTNSLADDAEVPASAFDTDALQQQLDQYANDYEFGVRTGGGPRAPKDPVEREAYRIATEKVKTALTAKNIKINSVSKERMDELVRGVIAKYPAITEEAQRRVNSAGQIALDSLGL